MYGQILYFQVNCIAFSPDYELMVTGSDDASVRVFNVPRGGAAVCKLKGHTGSVHCVAVSVDSRYLASGSYDCTVRLWRTRDATCLHVLSGKWQLGEHGDIMAWSAWHAGNTAAEKALWVFLPGSLQPSSEIPVKLSVISLSWSKPSHSRGLIG